MGWATDWLLLDGYMAGVYDTCVMGINGMMKGLICVQFGANFVSHCILHGKRVKQNQKSS